MQEQKAENTGRQFCSCFYQLLGIGGPEARPWQDASWGVRVGTYVSLTSPSSCLSLSFFSFLRRPPSASSLPLWRVRLFSPFGPARRFVPPSHPLPPSLPSCFFRALVLFIETGCLRVPLGSSGSPSAMHSLHGMPYIYAR